MNIYIDKYLFVYLFCFWQLALEILDTIGILDIYFIGLCLINYTSIDGMPKIFIIDHYRSFVY